VNLKLGRMTWSQLFGLYVVVTMTAVSADHMLHNAYASGAAALCYSITYLIMCLTFILLVLEVTFKGESALTQWINSAYKKIYGPILFYYQDTVNEHYTLYSVTKMYGRKN
jgi:hypothetical protein